MTVYYNTVLTRLALIGHMNSVDKWLNYVRSHGRLWLLRLLMSYYDVHFKNNYFNPYEVICHLPYMQAIIDNLLLLYTKNVTKQLISLPFQVLHMRELPLPCDEPE